MNEIHSVIYKSTVNINHKIMQVIKRKSTNEAFFIDLKFLELTQIETNNERCHKSIECWRVLD